MTPNKIVPNGITEQADGTAKTNSKNNNPKLIALQARMRMPRLCVSAREAAELLAVSMRSLRRLEQRGLLRPSRGLRVKRYLHSDLIAYLEGSK